MRKLAGSLKYQHFIAVSGWNVYGLLDMMRYERAIPFESHDASIIAEMLHRPDSQFTVVLCAFQENRRPNWTDRWRSFQLEIEELADGREHHIERKVETFRRKDAPAETHSIVLKSEDRLEEKDTEILRGTLAECLQHFAETQRVAPIKVQTQESQYEIRELKGTQ